MSTPTNVETVAYVVNEAKGDFQLEDIIIDEVRDDELLIEMKYSGICHSDFLIQSGLVPSFKFPAILGHEGAGYVRAIGSSVEDKDIHVGDFVLLGPNYCGKCKQCSRGHPAYCGEAGHYHLVATRVSDGSSSARLKDGRVVTSHFFGQSSFAKMNVVHQSCVIKFPYEPEKAANFAACGCGFQTGAGTVLNVLKAEKDDTIAIFGMGSVGLAALMAAKSVGLKQIIGVDIVNSRLELAKELGATHVINSKNTPDFVAEIMRISGKGVNFCIDCAGNAAVIEGMIECLAKLGTAVGVGIPKPGTKFSIDPMKFQFGWKRYISVVEGDADFKTFIPELVEMQRRGEFPVEKLCTVYPYREMKQAIADTHSGKVVKAVIQWS